MYSKIKDTQDWGSSADININDIAYNTQLLLNDIGLVNLLFEKSTEIESLPLDELMTLLYAFFDSNLQSRELLRWAIHEEVGATQFPGEICRTDTALAKLFYSQLFDDLGLKYLSLLVMPLINDIISYNGSLEIEENQETNGADLEKNLDWFLQRIQEFLDRMSESTDFCPLSLRTSFFDLQKAVQKKFSNYVNSVESILFLRFICPSLISPVKFELISKEKFESNPYTYRGLIIASKLLLRFANKTPYEGVNEKAVAKINEFMEKNSSVLSNFILQLTDEKAIIHAQRVIEASVKLERPEHEIHLATDNLQSFLQEYHLGKTVELELQYKSEYDKLMEAYNDKSNWTNNLDKIHGVTVSTKKMEGNKRIHTFKVEVKVRSDMRSVFNVMNSLYNWGKFDSRIKKIARLEVFDKNHEDWYVQQSPFFPFAPRDFVITHHHHYNAKKSYTLGYSISRSDVPAMKDFVRASILFGTILDRDIDDPDLVKITYISRIDPRGQVPKWLINQGTNSHFSYLRNIQEHLEGIVRKKSDAKAEPAITK